jgi:YebC/PmpR family DNA-binding regulatory protein
MARHSKWANIKHRKSATDAKKGKIFTKLAKVVAVAAQKGGDMETNASLRVAVEKARAANVPAANIERAIKKGTGEAKDGVQMHEMIYEGYGPHGVAIMAFCLTDNTNRAFANLRNIMTKNGGSWGSSGCVAWMFTKKGVIVAEADQQKKDEFELLLIDAGAEDIEWDGDVVMVKTDPGVFEQCVKVFNGMVVQNSEVSLIAKEQKIINDEKITQEILELIDVLEEDDDVVEVVTNAIFPEFVGG